MGCACRAVSGPSAAMLIACAIGTSKGVRISMRCGKIGKLPRLPMFKVHFVVPALTSGCVCGKLSKRACPSQGTNTRGNICRIASLDLAPCLIPRRYKVEVSAR